MRTSRAARRRIARSRARRVNRALEPAGIGARRTAVTIRRGDVAPPRSLIHTSERRRGPGIRPAVRAARAPDAPRAALIRLRAACLAAGILVAATLPAVARGQRDTEHAADSLLRQALDQARAGDTSAALKSLERANKIAPNYAPALYQRGVMLSRASKLGMSDILRRRTAWQLISRAHDLDRGNPFYLMELGRLRLKTPFLRLDAERLFNKALSAAIDGRDPRVLAEIQWELGQIHERRYMTMAHRRLITGSTVTFDVESAISDWHYTADFMANTSVPIDGAGELDYRKAEDHYRAALVADATHVGAAVSLMGLFYEGGRYEEMVLMAGDLRASLPGEPRIAMAHGLALHRLDREAEAAAAFEIALALLDPTDRRSMSGLENILRDEAARSYAKLGESERLAMDSSYWDISDPLRLTAVNEARLEFLARVAYSELRFSSPEFRVRGWETDRGVVYVRYGPPPLIATFSPEVSEIEGSDAIGRVTYVWWYPETKLRFVFIGPPAMNYAYFAGNFRSYSENARYLAPVRYDNLKASLRIDSIPVQVARFRADTGALTDMSIYADLPVGRMLSDIDIAQNSLETGLFVTDARRRTVASQRDTILTKVRESDVEMQRVWRRVIAPGDYIYRVESREHATGRSARALAPLEIDRFDPGAFALSDVLVADRIQPRNPAVAPRNRDDFLIVPNAAMRLAQKDTMYLYWEVYGATPDSTGTARLEVSLILSVAALDRGARIDARILGGIADAVGLSAKGDERVALRYQRSVAISPDDRIPNQLDVAIGDAPYGTYTLELTVRDLTSGKTATRQRVLTLPRP